MTQPQKADAPVSFTPQEIATRAKQNLAEVEELVRLAPEAMDYIGAERVDSIRGTRTVKPEAFFEFTEMGISLADVNAVLRSFHDIEQKPKNKSAQDSISYFKHNFLRYLDEIPHCIADCMKKTGLTLQELATPTVRQNGYVVGADLMALVTGRPTDFFLHTKDVLPKETLIDIITERKQFTSSTTSQFITPYGKEFHTLVDAGFKPEELLDWAAHYGSAPRSRYYPTYIGNADAVKKVIEGGISAAEMEQVYPAALNTLLTHPDSLLALHKSGVPLEELGAVSHAGHVYSDYRLEKVLREPDTYLKLRKAGMTPLRMGQLDSTAPSYGGDMEDYVAEELGTLTDLAFKNADRIATLADAGGQNTDFWDHLKSGVLWEAKEKAALNRIIAESREKEKA